MNAAFIEYVQGIEPRSVIHLNHGSKLAVAQIGPVTDISVSDSNDVHETITRHVGHVHGVLSVRSHPNGAHTVIQKLHIRSSIFVAVHAERREPREDLVCGYEHIGEPIAS